MKTLPKSFCIKANQEHKLWKEYIQWLNEKRGNYNGYNGLSDSYYGINKHDSIYCSDNAWGEVITLEEWHQAVNAKSEFPEPVFVTKSGVEIYDEEEVLVWDCNELYTHKALLIAKTKKGYITLSSMGLTLPYKNAKPIPKEIEVTMEEIAKWKGVDVKQIKIK